MRHSYNQVQVFYLYMLYIYIYMYIYLEWKLQVLAPIFLHKVQVSTHKQLETHGFVLSTVATDDLVLKH